MKWNHIKKDLSCGKRIFMRLSYIDVLLCFCIQKFFIYINFICVCMRERLCALFFFFKNKIKFIRKCKCEDPFVCAWICVEQKLPSSCYQWHQNHKQYQCNNLKWKFITRIGHHVGVQLLFLFFFYLAQPLISHTVLFSFTTIWYNEEKSQWHKYLAQNGLNFIMLLITASFRFAQFAMWILIKSCQSFTFHHNNMHSTNASSPLIDI